MDSLSRARALAPLLALVTLGCAVNPATGKRELSLVPRTQEIEMGKQASDEVSTSIGLYDNAALQSYVSELGKRLAAVSERPELPWTFKVVDDSVVNAFALPGGYIFVTRGIMAHLNNEAQLASVLGHEIGHVAAKHSVSQISKAQVAQLGLGLGMIFSETARKYGQIGLAGLSVMMIQFTRSDENEADELGLRYAYKGGWDVREMPEVFAVLKRVGGSGGRLPEWLSTHPYPENRIENTQARLAKLELKPGATVNSAGYVKLLDGIEFGPNPRQGFFQGDRFLHPEMRFTVDFPAGWQHANTKEAVVGQSGEQDAAVQITLAKEGISPAQALREFTAKEGIKVSPTPLAITTPLPSESTQFTATTEQGEVAGLVTFLAHQARTFQIVAFTTADKFPAYGPVMARVPASFAPLTDATTLNVQPAHLYLDKVPRSMTLAQLRTERASTASVETLALINQVEPDTTLKAGQTIKWVKGGMPESKEGAAPVSQGNSAAPPPPPGGPPPPLGGPPPPPPPGQ